MSVWAIKEELFVRLSVATNASAAVNLQSERAGSDEMWIPDFIGVYNNSGESVSVQLAIFRPEITLPFYAKQTVQSGDAFGTNNVPRVGPLEQIGAVVTGSANKAQVWLILSGWKYTWVKADPPAAQAANPAS
jgi:hypothetical protein